MALVHHHILLVGSWKSANSIIRKVCRNVGVSVKCKWNPPPLDLNIELDEFPKPHGGMECAWPCAFSCAVLIDIRGPSVLPSWDYVMVTTTRVTQTHTDTTTSLTKTSSLTTTSVSVTSVSMTSTLTTMTATTITESCRSVDVFFFKGKSISALPETSIAPVNWWLEDYLPFRMPCFQVRTVGFSEDTLFVLGPSIPPWPRLVPSTRGLKKRNWRVNGWKCQVSARFSW